MIPILESMNVPKNKMMVVHNPIDLNKKIKTNLKNQLNIRHKKVIFYAGRLTKEKGIQYVIRAMKHIDNAIFLIAGRKTGNYAELNNLVTRLNLQDKVKFIGFIEHSSINEYYSISDLVVLVEKFYEPLSRMLLEAQSHRIPCIVNDIGGNSEIIENGKNGILLKSLNVNNLAAKMNQILNDSKLTKKMRSYAAEKITNSFSLKVVGKRLLNEYIKVLKN
jgi:spore coat protein SA